MTTLDRVRDIQDPKIRAVAATEHRAEFEELADEAMRIRNEACAELLAAGASYQDVATLIGTTRALVWGMFNPKNGTWRKDNP